jgi:hypothetical protein
MINRCCPHCGGRSQFVGVRCDLCNAPGCCTVQPTLIAKHRKDLLILFDTLAGTSKNRIDQIENNHSLRLLFDLGFFTREDLIEAD